MFTNGVNTNDSLFPNRDIIIRFNTVILFQVFNNNTNHQRLFVCTLQRRCSKLCYSTDYVSLTYNILFYKVHITVIMIITSLSYHLFVQTLACIGIAINVTGKTVSATSADTRKVIEVEIFSKFCKHLNRQNHSPNCLANYESSSGGMEVKGAVEIFQCSLTKNVFYNKSMGTCLRQQKTLHIYEDSSIIKLKCIYHVQKYMCSRLYKLKNNSKDTNLSDSRPLSGKNRLIDAVINQIQTYCVLAI